MRARQKVSRAGVELIKSFEGLRTVAARLPDGRWTLGYGHTFSAREGARATQEDADALLRFDLLPIVDALNNMVLVPLNQNQFDALVSFCFNIGTDNFAASTVLKRINEGRFADAALAMDSWRSAEFNGQTYVLAPLIRRRAAEKSLFMSPEETSQPSGLMMRPVEDMSDDIPTFARAPETPSAPPQLAAAEVYNPEVAPAPVALPPVALPPVDAPVTPAYMSPYASPRPVEAPAASTPVVAPVHAPAPTYSPATDYSPAPDYTPAPGYSPAPVMPDRQVIDLSSYASNVTQEPVSDPVPSPKPTIVRMADVSPYQPEAVRPAAVSPDPVRSEQPVVEHLPDGVIPASVVREVPPLNPYASQFTSPFAQAVEVPEPRMSAEVQAALQRAKEEEALREETLRQARAMAAARQAEELRLQDEARLREEATRQYELQRQEALRAEAARQEHLRQEHFRQEQLRLDYERHERERQEQFRLEQAMAIEAARAEAVRAEQERLDAERREADRQAYLRQETDRQEAERLEVLRIEAARFEAERVEAARVEAARVERDRVEREQAEQARLEQARFEQVKRETEAEAARQAAASPKPAAEDDAEKARKAEAAAALMRLYSPYGSGALGRPLTSASAQLVPQQPTPPPPSPVPAAPIEVSSRPEDLSPAQSATQGFGQGFGQAFGQSVPMGFAQAPVQPVPQPVQSPAPSIEPETDTLSVPTQEPGTIRHFAPVTSASTLPPPTVVAMSPYAQPIRATEPDVVEVPRPSPINLAAPSMAPVIEAAKATAPEPALHWRDQLQRPLPQDYEVPDARRTPRPGPLSSAATHYEQDLSDEDDWTMDGGRIAVSSEDHSDAGPSFGSMIVSTRWVLFSSSVAMACLGFAAGFYVKSKDLTIIRNGLFTNYMWWSVGLAAIGILFLSISVWQIMKRLGGLKD